MASAPIPKAKAMATRVYVTSAELRLQLRLASSARDPRVAAYLTASGPDERAFYLSEAHLRLAARGRTGERPSFRRGDARPVTGEAMQVPLTFLPTSVLVPAGYRLGLRFASWDGPSFEPGEDFESDVLPGSRLRLPARWRA